MRVSVELSAEEKMLAETYAKRHSLSLGEAFKKALFEKIEDEYAAAVAKEAYAEYGSNGRKSRPVAELWEDLGL